VEFKDINGEIYKMSKRPSEGSNQMAIDPRELGLKSDKPT
jgi:hypothetical protein